MLWGQISSHWKVLQNRISMATGAQLVGHRLANVRDILDDVYNVRYFGIDPANSPAVNDARWVDLTDAIQDAAISGIGQKTIYFPEVESDRYYEFGAPLLLEDIIQCRITGGQGAHIRNFTGTGHLLHIRGTAGFGNVFGFIVDNLFFSHTGASGNGIQLERCILSWLQNLYVDGSPNHAIDLDGASSENLLGKIIIETPGGAGVNNRGDLGHFENIHIVSAGASGFVNAADANENTAVGIKAYLCQNHGVEDNGNLNSLVLCTGRNNSQSGADVYSGIAMSGTNGQCLAARGYDTQGVPTQRHGLRAAGSNNQVIGVQGTGNLTSLVHDAGTGNTFVSAGSQPMAGFTVSGAIDEVNAPFIADGDTTPSVSGAVFYRCNDTVATATSTLDDMPNNAERKILVEGETRTFTHSASFKMPGSVDLVVAVNEMALFKKVGTVIYGYKL